MTKQFWAIVAIIVIAFGGIIFFQHKQHPSSSSTSNDALASPSLMKNIASVTTATLDAIGSGTANAKLTAITAPNLTDNGKPEIFYEGAEYCPYCATERWPLIQALSRFGTFSGLKTTHSSSTDVYPNTQTLSFYGSTYTSQYLSFVPVEVYSNIPDGAGYTTLQTPTSAETSLVNKYDAAPYLPSNEANAIPFIDFGGHYLIAGATYSPTILQGVSASDISSSLSNSQSPIAKGIDGAANDMTAAICKITNNQPSTVCDATIQKLESSL